MSVPSNVVQFQGIGSVGADNLNSYTQNVTTAVMLRSFIGASGMFVLLGGIAYVGDGLGGIFFWSPAATGPDDNMDVIVPTAASAGAWLRLATSSFVAGSPQAIDASAGSVIVTTAPGSGATTIVKIDATTNSIYLSIDGTMAGVYDFIQAAAVVGAKGIQVNGWRMVYFSGGLPFAFGNG